MPSLKGPLIGLVVAPILTWLTYSMAVSIQAGEEIKISGRRSAYKRLFAWLAETLGTTGSLVAGGLLTLAMAAWLIFTLKARAKAKA
jgi:hypothetical protein